MLLTRSSSTIRLILVELHRWEHCVSMKEAKQQEEEFALKRLEEKQKKLEQRLAAQRVFEQEARHALLCVLRSLEPL